MTGFRFILAMANGVIYASLICMSDCFPMLGIFSVITLANNLIMSFVLTLALFLDAYHFYIVFLCIVWQLSSCFSLAPVIPIKLAGTFPQWMVPRFWDEIGRAQYIWDPEAS